jgi:multimeric flavodoxin WrbA
MKIAFLNGKPQPSPLDDYLRELATHQQATGHTITRLDLRGMTLRYCIGWWGCWVKTPGECVARDASLEMDRAVINADFVLWAALLKMGFPSELLKRTAEKHLPLLHPNLVVEQG